MAQFSTATDIKTPFATAAAAIFYCLGAARGNGAARREKFVTKDQIEGQFLATAFSRDYVGLNKRQGGKPIMDQNKTSGERSV